MNASSSSGVNVSAGLGAYQKMSSSTSEAISARVSEAKSSMTQPSQAQSSSGGSQPQASAPGLGSMIDIKA